MDNIRKQLPEGTWVDSVNHQEQSAKDNLGDIVIGFFSGNLLNRENLRQVILDVIEYADTHSDKLFESSEELIPEILEEGETLHSFDLSICFVYQRIADFIVKELADMEFARQIYQRAEELAKDTADLSCLAESILYYLKDEEWHKRLMTKAHSKVKSCSDLLALEMDSWEN